MTDGGVAFVLGAAGTDEQDAGDYVLRVKATGSDGLTYVSIHRLTVYEDGDAGAP